MDEPLEVYDGGFGTTPGSASVNITVTTPPFQQAGRSVTIEATIRNTGTTITDANLNKCAYEIAKLALDFVPGADCFKLGAGIASNISEGIHSGQFDLLGYLGLIWWVPSIAPVMRFLQRKLSRL